MPSALLVGFVALAILLVLLEARAERRGREAEEARYDAMKRASERGEL